MDYEIVELSPKLIAGFSLRTNNGAADMAAKIGSVWERFYSAGGYADIPHKANAKALGVYTDYENDEKADYTFMAACEVTAPPADSQYTVYTIPAGRYARFIVHGDVQKALAEAWQDIWQLGLPRTFNCDFEEYQNDSMENAEIHIYIGLREE